MSVSGDIFSPDITIDLFYLKSSGIIAYYHRIMKYREIFRQLGRKNNDRKYR